MDNPDDEIEVISIFIFLYKNLEYFLNKIIRLSK